ncbi:secreted protein [Candidatus Magnetobacterium bavaricum]|uniref:Secreted protein n=1 Tax=Candidatus Magnetobacterium bavaricum TaxID=29290 RepID=A0A0F3GIM3_9BACT|nr:secreted protein [Candidatus Magnetobacterium bavaricum]
MLSSTTTLASMGITCLPLHSSKKVGNIFALASVFLTSPPSGLDFTSIMKTLSWQVSIISTSHSLPPTLFLYLRQKEPGSQLKYCFIKATEPGAIMSSTRVPNCLAISALSCRAPFAISAISFRKASWSSLSFRSLSACSSLYFRSLSAFSSLYFRSLSACLRSRSACSSLYFRSLSAFSSLYFRSLSSCLRSRSAASILISLQTSLNSSIAASNRSTRDSNNICIAFYTSLSFLSLSTFYDSISDSRLTTMLYPVMKKNLLRTVDNCIHGNVKITYD